jgi:cytochrome c oxidase assembly protein subunit 15
VGVLVVALTRWLGGRPTRTPLLIIGGAEILAGLALLKLGADWRGAGHFLSGIGGVVLLGGVVWMKNVPAAKPLPALGWWAFWLVLDSHVVAGAKLGLVFGLLHGCLAQAFLLLVCVIALFTSRWWQNPHPASSIQHLDRSVRRLFLFTTVLIFLQLILGATMRHQHAGLAIPDFPLAYGKLLPDTSAAAVAGYNAQRVELAGENPITAGQIWLQLAHRGLAVVILVVVAACAWRTWGTLRRPALLWLGLILVQASLGVWTIWSNKAADVATAHVVVGALSLVTGALLTIITFRFSGAAQR